MNRFRIFVIIVLALFTMLGSNNSRAQIQSASVHHETWTLVLPEGQPLEWDSAILETFGPVDLLAEVSGRGTARASLVGESSLDAMGVALHATLHAEMFSAEPGPVELTQAECATWLDLQFDSAALYRIEISDVLPDHHGSIELIADGGTHLIDLLVTEPVVLEGELEAGTPYFIKFDCGWSEGNATAFDTQIGFRVDFGATADVVATDAWSFSGIKALFR